MKLAWINHYTHKLASFLRQGAANPVWTGSVFIFWGLFLSYYLSVKSGFALVPGDFGDGRLNHYFLEYSWRWITGAITPESYWDAPFFYPLKNTMAFSDTLLGAAPLYWLFRAAGCTPDLAYLLWPGILGIINWLCMYALLRKSLNVDVLPAGCGAFLFAFCAPRLIKLAHIQFWPHFYTPLFIMCLVYFYKNRNSTPTKAHLALIGTAICAVLQFYAGFYLGWFLALGCIIFALASFCRKSTRLEIYDMAKRNWLWFVAALAVFMFMAAPMIMHYLEAFRQVGPRPWFEISTMLPTLATWFATPGPLYRDFIDYARPNYIEHMNGIGWITLPLCIYGLWLGCKKSDWYKNLAWSAVVLFILLSEDFAGFHFWNLVVDFIPGGASIRAVARIFYLFLVVFAIGYALTMQKARFRWQIGLVFILVLENAAPGYMRDQRNYQTDVAPVAELAKKHKLPFAYISDEDPLLANLAAMWASLEANRPTYNGYSGQNPNDRFSIAGTSLASPEKSPVLTAIRGPYLLIVREKGSTKALIVNSPEDLAKAGIPAEEVEK